MGIGVRARRFIDRLDPWRVAISKQVGRSAISEADERRLRAAQIGAVMALTPSVVVANVLNMAIVDAMLVTDGRVVVAAVWSTALGGSLIALVDSWRRVRANPSRREASRRGVVAMTKGAFAFGLLWGVPIVVTFARASDAERATLVGLAAGMICGGAMAYATVWQAALAYCVALGASTALAIALRGDPAYLGLLALAASYMAMTGGAVAERSKLFIASRLANFEARRQAGAVASLLGDFEASASNFLWETDAAGLLTRASDRFYRSLGVAPSDPGIVSLPAALDGAMSARMATGKAFHRLAAATRRADAPRDWLLSAKPIRDGRGDIAGWRGVAEDVTDTMRAQLEVERLASFDALTGLPNRRQLQARAEALLPVPEGGAPIALLCVDLDRFKFVNDTLGHAHGDALLCEVARRVRECLGKDDVVARTGGDEFVALVRAGPARAADVAEAIVARVSAPYAIGGSVSHVGASVGVAVAPGNGDSFAELLRNSDVALYRAKAGGKGRAQFFTAEIDAAVRRRRGMESDLRAAARRGELALHYQPLIDMASGRVTACEALLRWRHPEWGDVPPATFIPIAEESGYIVALGEWVIRRACAEARLWPRGIRIAVNVSALQFRAPGFVEMTADALARTGLEPGRLEIEITESVLIEDAAGTMERLERLRALGARISLDDFGTGYSSLAYLNRFSFDKLKIDRSFVAAMSENAGTSAIVRAIAQMAAALGIETTAEGVETQAQLDALRSFGCSEAQGFLFSPPVSANAIGYLIGKAETPDAGARDAAVA